MSEPKSPTNHLGVIHDQLARLVALLERTAPPSATRDADEADRDAAALALARALLHEVGLAERLIAAHAEAAAALRRIDAVYVEGVRRLDEVRDRLDDVERPATPDLHERPPSTGSVIGDSVRDSFLNLSP